MFGSNGSNWQRVSIDSSMLNRRQAITWTKVHHVLWRHITSLGYNELAKLTCLDVWIWTQNLVFLSLMVNVPIAKVAKNDTNITMTS